MTKDDGTTGRQDDEKSSPAAFGTRGTNSRQPVGPSSCRPFSEPARGVLHHSGQDCRIGRMNRMGGMGSVNPDHPGILSKRCRARGGGGECQQGGALAEPSDSSELDSGGDRNSDELNPSANAPGLCVVLLRPARGVRGLLSSRQVRKVREGRYPESLCGLGGLCVRVSHGGVAAPVGRAVLGEPRSRGRPRRGGSAGTPRPTIAGAGGVRGRRRSRRGWGRASPGKRPCRGRCRA